MERSCTADEGSLEGDQYLPVCRPNLWGNESKYVSEALSEGWISSRGRFLSAFENSFSRFAGRRFASATSSGTTALHLALRALGLGRGDEVIVPDFTMMAPVFAVRYCGAQPIPVDADETWNIDAERIEERISPRTKGIIVVHTYGHPARVDRILEMSRKHSLFLLEDAAEAHGAELGGQLVGTFGEAAIYSFYANKLITTGEGGMVVTDDESLHQTVVSEKNLCFGKTSESRFEHTGVGFNYRMSNLQAAIGVAQMEHATEAINAKIAVADSYRRALKGINGLTLPPRTPNIKNVYWVFGVLIDDDFGMSRADVQARLAEVGIETRRFFTPLHRQNCFDGVSDPHSFPQAERLAARGFYLPSFIGMGEKAVVRVAEALRQIQRRRGDNKGRRRLTAPARGRPSDSTS